MGNFNTYFRASLTEDINAHFNIDSASSIEEHPLSKAGKLLRWHVHHLPQKVVDFFSQPRVVVVALTVLGMLAVQFVFYPTATALAFKAAFSFVAKHISFNQVHFALYLASMSYVLGNGLLAFGRLSQSRVIAEINHRLQLSRV